MEMKCVRPCKCNLHLKTHAGVVGPTCMVKYFSKLSGGEETNVDSKVFTCARMSSAKLLVPLLEVIVISEALASRLLVAVAVAVFIRVEILSIVLELEATTETDSEELLVDPLTDTGSACRPCPTRWIRWPCPFALWRRCGENAWDS